MSSSELEALQVKLAESVGEFIKYWGFKEIHGKLWVLIYLSEEPISAKDMTRLLGVTKGLVSTALAELVAYQVVEKVNIGDGRSAGYQSTADLVEVIYNVLRNRELKLTIRIHENIENLSHALDECDPKTRDKVTQLKDMSGFAVDSINKLLNDKAISVERFKKIMRVII